MNKDWKYTTVKRKKLGGSEMSRAGQDKQSRLTLITHLIQQGKVLFPRFGAEELIQQLVGFGTEKHDDLADAFAILLLKIIEEDNIPQPNIWFLDVGDPYRRKGLSDW